MIKGLYEVKETISFHIFLQHLSDTERAERWCVRDKTVYPKTTSALNWASNVFKILCISFLQSWFNYSPKKSVLPQIGSISLTSAWHRMQRHLDSDHLLIINSVFLALNLCCSLQWCVQVKCRTKNWNLVRRSDNLKDLVCCKRP